MLKLIIYFVLSLLCGFLIGYNLGYFKGKTKGIKLGLNRAPLEILEKSLEEGICQICNNHLNK